MAVYYNEFDPGAADWLEELIWRGEIPDGHVDRRSIVDVKSSDLEGFTSCHFFAGIAGWPLALRLAGWPDDLPVWTGSPPCQPFSAAGRQKGKADPRHLAPTWLRLVEESQPPILFGEQVEKAIGTGWLDDLCDELEFSGYACGSSVLAAGGIGAPHQRLRLFFAAVRMADTDRFREDWRQVGILSPAARRAAAHYWPDVGVSGQPGGTDGDVLFGVANGDSQRHHGRGQSGMRTGQTGEREAAIRSDEVRPVEGLRPADVMADGAGQRPEGIGLLEERGDTDPEAAGNGEAVCLADQHSQRCEGQRSDRHPEGREGSYIPADRLRHGTGAEGVPDTHHRAWGDSDWLLGVDGNFRPVRPGSQPLAYGLSGIVGPGSAALKKLAGRNRNARLKGYGNAIVPGLAAEFITGFVGAIGDIEDDEL